MRLLVALLLPTTALTCIRTAANTVGNRSPISSDATASRLSQRAPSFPCAVTPFKLCLEGWICDSTAISVEEGVLHCSDGAAILVKEGNSMILATETACKDKKWQINKRNFTQTVEATCGSIVPRGRSLRRGGVQDGGKKTEKSTVSNSSPSTHSTTIRPTTTTTVRADDDGETWIGRMKQVQESIRENELVKRRLVTSLNEARSKADRTTYRRLHKDISGHALIHRELIKKRNELLNERKESRKVGLTNTSTTQQRLPTLLPTSLSSLGHVPSYAELLALQGYEAMPQIYTPPPNPFDTPVNSINHPTPTHSFNSFPINSPSSSSSFPQARQFPALQPYSSYRRCGRILQSTSECPDGRICSSYSHLGEHRITCPNGGHVAIELPDGHLELMVSSLICPEGSTEWTAENSQGQQGQRVGSDVVVTCIQECACTPLSSSPVCPPSQRCSPASFLIDMDDQCMLYECGDGKTLFVRNRYGWQPASHVVCGPGGEYLLEGKDKIGSNPTVTCVLDGEGAPFYNQRRRVSRRKFYSN